MSQNNLSQEEIDALLIAIKQKPLEFKKVNRVESPSPVHDNIVTKESSQSDKNIALIDAIHHGQMNQVQKLLEIGARLKGLDGEDGLMFLRSCARHGYLEVANWLFSQGAEPKKNKLILQDAIQNGHLEMVRLLLDHDAHPGNFFSSNLQIASRINRPDIFQLLVDRGADIISLERLEN